ncbi:MAG: DUF2807 domain-containing protein [Bacteroidales bacterium]|nr:DUF2807 domain-containing protein [Bacteroidales bacterium]
MKKTFTPYVILLLFMSAVNAQTPVTRDLEPFTGLTVGDRIIVRLVKSDKESADIQAQGIDASAVKTVVNAGELEISIYGEPFTKKKVMITLHYVKLNSISVNGGAEVTTTSLCKAKNLKIDLKSGGMLYLDADIGQLNGKIAEGAILTAEGYAVAMDMLVSSTATLSAYDFECDTVRIKAVSGGKAKINVEKTLDAEASSKGYISYKGNPPSVTKNATSGGSISVYEP